ncbi:MAG: methyltransferase domain-containing protein [Deltaproteobacteria bacterium]|jgi:cyclopropane fatty-acyl-phospholipid synthase-like methyltransferase|nr:methyltransferase domain-containing protein [Deltaproteobacteria bacterium]
MKKYPRTEKYDASWIEKNWMGPNPLWLTEELCEHLELRPGMRVLDMGCGKGLTSVFLAKEYGVTVFANDLWISSTDNLHRFEYAGVADRVFPIHAEAHALPFADGFFDVAIAIDSYHYFGAGESYFPDVFSKLVKPGGQFGIVVPGLVREYEKGYPDTLAKLWCSNLFTMHSHNWWRKLWEKTGLCEVIACYGIDDPKALWWPWANWAKENFAKEFGGDGDFDVKYLEADTGDDIALIALTAKKL